MPEAQAAQPEAQQSEEAPETQAPEQQSDSVFGKGTAEPTPSGNSQPEPDTGSDPFSKFKDNEGNVDIEGVQKSYLELQSKIGQKKEKLLEEARKEERERLGNVPETPDAYTVPEQFEFDGIAMSVPEDDKLLNWFKQYAHTNNMPQAHFEDAIKSYLEVQASTLPNLDAVMKELGDNAKDRIGATDSWLAANMPPALYDAVAQHANSKEYIEAMEWLVDKVREPNYSQEEGQHAPGKLTLEELRQMQDDPRYWRDKDENFIRKVQEGYKRLFG